MTTKPAAQHSPEPWATRAGQPGYQAVIYTEKRDTHIATCGVSTQDQRNAKRIVACVNACAGLTDADLAALRSTDGSETAIGISAALAKAKP